MEEQRKSGYKMQHQWRIKNLIKLITKIITYLDLVQFCIRPTAMDTRSLSQNVTLCAHFKTIIIWIYQWLLCIQLPRMNVGNSELNRIKYINSYLISRFKRPDLQMKKSRRWIQNLSQNPLQAGNNCFLDFQHSFISEKGGSVKEWDLTVWSTWSVFMPW